VLVITDQIVPGVDYDITVVAFNDVGDSIPSDPKTIMAAAVPDLPLSVTLVEQGPSAITISWTAPYDGGTPISNYKIWWDNASGSLPATFVEKEGSTGLVVQFTIQTNIVTDSVYQFAVKAVNIIGDSSLSDPITIRAAEAPDAPIAPTK
jgi:hypothetical protein